MVSNQMDMDLSGGDCGGGDQQQQQQQQQQPPPGAGGGGGGGQQPDLTAELLQRFSCMNTTDRDVLVNQLKLLLGEHVTDDSAHFWLDMNNWNLQAAICSYFDYEQPEGMARVGAGWAMKLVNDVTIGEGEEVPPNANFTKTWRIANSGTEPWPIGCHLRFMAGDQMCHSERVLVDPLGPGDHTDIAVDMISPQKSGIYTGQWRMSTPTGQYFGEIIWVIISVSEGGLLEVTQQMSRFNELGAASPPSSGGHMMAGGLGVGPGGAAAAGGGPMGAVPAIHVNPFATNQLQTHLGQHNTTRLHFDTHFTNNNNNNNNSNNNSNQNADHSMPNSDHQSGWG